MKQLDFKVKQDVYNPLLKRKELAVEVDHENASSPTRTSLREAVAAKYGTKLDNVFVLDIETRTGGQLATCVVQVYDDAEVAKRIVPKYIQVRNLPSEERKKLKEAATKSAEEKPKPEKPKTEKPKPEEKKTEEKPKATGEEQQKTEKSAAKPSKEEKTPETKPTEGKSKGTKTKEGPAK